MNQKRFSHFHDKKAVLKVPEIGEIFGICHEGIKTAPKATYDMYTWKIDQWDQKRKSETKILMRLSEQLLELVSVFMEASRNFAMDQDILL